MRLSKEDRDEKIVESYKRGLSYRQLQEKYRVSPNYIDKLVKGIEVKCHACGRPKGKARFRIHRPDRLNRPDYTVPLCPACHVKEEAKLRQEKEKQSRPSSDAVPPAQENPESRPTSTSPPVFSGPLSPTGKKVLMGLGVAALVELFSPGFFEKRWKEIQAHWQKTSDISTKQPG